MKCFLSFDIILFAFLPQSVKLLFAKFHVSIVPTNTLIQNTGSFPAWLEQDCVFESWGKINFFADFLEQIEGKFRAN